MLRACCFVAVVLALGCAHAPPPTPVVACPEAEPAPTVQVPQPLPTPTSTQGELSAQVVALAVVSSRPFEEVGSFPGMKLDVEVRSTGRGIVGFAEERSVLRSVKDDVGTILWDAEGAHGPVGMHPGISASIGLDRDPSRLELDLRVPAPSTGAREVTVDAELAVMVGGEPEVTEAPLRVAVGETFALGGVAFTVSAVGPSSDDEAAMAVRLRVTDEAIGKALLDSLEIVGDNGPVRIVRRGWMSQTQPEPRTELTLDLATAVENVTLRARFPRDLEIVMLPFRVRVGIGSVVQPALGY